MEDMIHHLKTVQPYFEDVWNGHKNFELRKNDRDFKAGDVVILKEFDGANFSKRQIIATIGYVIKDVPNYGLQDGFCILALTDQTLQTLKQQ